MRCDDCTKERRSSSVETSWIRPKVFCQRFVFALRSPSFDRPDFPLSFPILTCISPTQLRAFERFLHDYPQWAGKVVLIQVTSPSSGDSPAIATKVSELVDGINAVYGTLEFQPVKHFHQTVERDVCTSLSPHTSSSSCQFTETSCGRDDVDGLQFPQEYFALLTVADVALVTSIRDGMNTTSSVEIMRLIVNPLTHFSRYRQNGVYYLSKGSERYSDRFGIYGSFCCARSSHQSQSLGSRSTSSLLISLSILFAPSTLLALLFSPASCESC